MTERDKIRELIRELIQHQQISSGELREMGFGRNNVEVVLAELRQKKVIYKHGNGKATWYTDSPVMEKKESITKNVPDLPDNILFMMGYTKIPVNKRYAERFYG